MTKITFCFLLKMSFFKSSLVFCIFTAQNWQYLKINLKIRIQILNFFPLIFLCCLLNLLLLCEVTSKPRQYLATQNSAGSTMTFINIGQINDIESGRRSLHPPRTHPPTCPSSWLPGKLEVLVL